MNDFHILLVGILRTQLITLICETVLLDFANHCLFNDFLIWLGIIPAVYGHYSKIEFKIIDGKCLNAYIYVFL